MRLSSYHTWMVISQKLKRLLFVLIQWTWQTIVCYLVAILEVCYHIINISLLLYKQTQLFKYVPNKLYLSELFFLEICSGFSPISVHLSQNVFPKLDEVWMPGKLFPIRLEQDKYLSCYMKKNPLSTCKYRLSLLELLCVTDQLHFQLTLFSICLAELLLHNHLAKHHEIFFLVFSFLGLSSCTISPTYQTHSDLCCLLQSASTLSYYNLKYKFVKWHPSPSPTPLT